MAETIERLPFPISKRLASVIETAISKNGREFHYAVGGVPFRLHVTPETPLTLETAPQQKNQQDVEPEAGEQTLAGWWLRSQSSFHEGTGFLYAESRGEAKETSFYRDSKNIDVWTPGEIKLLKRAAEVSGTTNKCVVVVPDPTVFSVVVGRTGEIVRYTNLDSGVATTTLATVGGVTFTQVIATSTTWYAAGDNGSVYSGSLTTPGAPSVWTLTGASGSFQTRIAWAKHRLWAVNGPAMYVLNAGTPGATAAHYTHPSTAWRYTDIAETTGGVLFSGYGDGTSHLQRVTLNADGSVPTLSGATTTAVLPTDERALRVSSLTGSMLAILTSRGLRVAQTDTSGALVYGPLLMERTTEVSLTAKPALTAAGRFWWASWGDEAKLWRVDSSTQVEEGVFAYARDMEYGASVFSDISVRGDRPVVVTAGGALVYRHATERESEGFIQTGRIRFRTEEDKRFQYIDVSTDPMNGSITLDVLNEGDTPRSLITYNEPGQASLPTAEVPIELGPMRWMSVKLTMNRSSTDATKGPVVHGIQVKALPSAKPQRIYTLPLSCYDNELWSSGQRDPYGYDGYARDRYMAVRAAEDAGGVVVLRDYRFPDSPVGELCKIEALKFVQVVQGDPSKQAGGFGGVLFVTLRTLA